MRKMSEWQKCPAVKDALEDARKEIARLTKLTRIMAWEMAYDRSFDPPAIGKWADAHIESAGNISFDNPLYADMKSYVEQEATK